MYQAMLSLTSSREARSPHAAAGAVVLSASNDFIVATTQTSPARASRKIEISASQILSAEYDRPGGC
jgi:hypothetical protein